MIHFLTNTYQMIDPLFGQSPRPVELDLGCGKGRFTLDLAERYPERLVLGADIMAGRLRKVSRKAEKRQLENLELLRALNLDLVALLLPPDSIDRAHLLCPDPWPKDKHRNKRLVTTYFLAKVADRLKPDGVLHLATDHKPYYEDWTRIIAELPFFENAPDAIADVADIKTDFELLWHSEGKQVQHLAYRCRKERL
ncbi:MAG: methyltransferase domain-containing protein [Lentisphaeria bacterium]|nr:methyltransferase domain-containing protein [Lentisphaeria bacterium]